MHCSNTKTYKYLGVVFDSAGTFSSTEVNMQDLGLNSMFKVISMDLFDKNVRPVCVYGSEIWGQMQVSSTITPEKLLDKLF